MSSRRRRKDDLQDHSPYAKKFCCIVAMIGVLMEFVAIVLFIIAYLILDHDFIIALIGAVVFALGFLATVLTVRTDTGGDGLID